MRGFDLWRRPNGVAPMPQNPARSLVAHPGGEGRHKSFCEGPNPEARALWRDQQSGAFHGK